MTVELKGMNVSRERGAATFNGYLMLLVTLALWACDGLALRGVHPAGRRRPARRRPRWRSPRSACCWRLSPLCGFFMIQPNQAGGDHAVRRLQGHRPDRRPALGVAVDDAQEALGPRAQRPFRAGQDQRPQGQPDRHRLQRGVARRRHRAGGVRRRRLQGVRRTSRSRPGLRTVGARHPYDDLEEEESHAARQPRRGQRRAAHRAQRAAPGRRDRGRRGGPDPPRLCGRDRRRDAPPPAGRGGDRRARQAGDGRGHDGRDGARTSFRKTASSTSTTSARRRWCRT